MPPGGGAHNTHSSRIDAHLASGNTTKYNKKYNKNIAKAPPDVGALNTHSSRINAHLASGNTTKHNKKYNKINNKILQNKIKTLQNHHVVGAHITHSSRIDGN